MNRIDGFADAMVGWLEEYKQKVSCRGESPNVTVAAHCESTDAAGIHLVRDAEIALGAHAANCNCLECGIAAKYEEE